ncbi:MAG: ABC transporter substrate-binding protein [Treponema sp.]|nr:ABC transporter substrate-binding protein [Treponema sp.]
MKKIILVSIALLALMATAAFAAGSGVITLTMATGAVGHEYDLSVVSAKEYMRLHPGIKVEVLKTPDLTTDRLGLFLQYFEAKSSDVDLMQIDVIWPGDIAENLVDLNRYGASKYVKDMFPAMVANDTVKGRLVAVPWFTDAGLLYYRADLLAKYGYKHPPKTWTELETMAKTIQDGERAAGNQDFWGYVWQGNSYEGLTCDGLEWLVSNGGGSIVEPDGRISIDNPKAAAALDMAASWVGSISPPGVTGYGEEDARRVFQAGNAAFMRNWPYAYSLGQASDSAIKDKFDVVPLPAGSAGRAAAALGGWQLAVSKYSKHPKEAADLLFFMTSERQQKMRAIDGSFQPTVKALYKDKDVLKAVPFFGKLFDVFMAAAPRPSTVTAPHYAEVSKVFYSECHDVLTGKQTGAEAVKNMSDEIKGILGQ